MATNNANVPSTVSALSADILITQGYMSTADASKAKAARTAIVNDGGYFPENGSDTLAVIANNVLSNAKAAARAGKSASLSLALIDESQEYARLLNPNHKPF